MQKKTRTAKVGLDYSKDKFNVSVLFNGTRADREFKNDLEGARDLESWLKQSGAKRFDVTFEPTGRYSENVSTRLWSNPNYRVFQVNPEVSSKYRGSLDLRTKSDFKDAYALAKLAEERADDLPEWEPKNDAQYELRDVQMRLRSIVKRKTHLKNQLKCGLSSQFIKDDIEDELRNLAEREKVLLAYATKLIDSDPQMREDRLLLQSIPGIGLTTAILLICLIDFRKFKSSRQLTCFLGLTRRMNESGTSVRGPNGISKKGSKYIRSSLFCPTWSAIRSNPAIEMFNERLKGNGKLTMVAQTACLRKLLAIAWAVVHRRCPFEREYKNPHLATA